MFRTLQSIAICFLATLLGAPLFAEPTPGPPEWQDTSPSVYGAKQEPPATEIPHTSLEPGGVEAAEAITPQPPPTLKVDPAVIPAIHEATAPATSDSHERRLAPPSNRFATTASAIGSPSQADGRSGAARGRTSFGMPFESMYTVLTALAIVIGAFLVFAWALRRGGRRTAAALPMDVVSVLGRVPLAARQFAQLLRVGNKLVLVSLTPNGAETLTEVTDPVEVDRLVGLCQQHSPHSATKAFEHVFRQLSGEAASGGFLGGDSLPPTFSTASAAYRAQRGETARG